METFLNDRVVIPEKIRAMTKEQTKAEIERLESEAAAQKIAILNTKGVKTDEKNT